ncbi:uncharacterized protein PITG_00097 [Phytophthora infestans T30-4]|uniref:RCC1-like domain-containing protein n=1 Tax=Phytophthora infestans (strain T30-4) TaxID=403677 RepID=D0MSV6_PHYIT|nr:uncharacterized protein PITG_00097 [Phytophthora infestans T30-4]EEY57540.1 conserved hypothetical protein [Phytophthora infestans T30-4]|eukprot:XP_002908726.1 conserved hypothetical protein [Phytophthora infestans T30-4]
MVADLKQALRWVCTFPNPIYQLIALRRQLMKSMHEAVAAQHRHWIAADKVTREATLGIQVLVCLLNDLHDATVSQRREFLEDLLPFLRSMGFLALCSRRNSAEILEFTDKIQRFLLDMCPRSYTLPTTSPKLPAISSGNTEQDVMDRTNAVNGLIHLAAATGSIRDFLVVLKVLLGVNNNASESMKDLRLSSRSLLTSSVPSLRTVRSEELLPNSKREDDLTQIHFKPGASCPYSNKPQTEILGDSTTQETFKKKTLKGVKTSAHTVSLAMHHRLLYSSPGNNLVNIQRTKEELKDALVMNASLSLDMTKMRDSTKSDTPVLTARCPKFRTLNVQCVLVELDRVKASVPTRGKPPNAFVSNDTTIFHEDEGEREVWSCGQNSYGELGHGDTASRKSFERIQALQQKEIIQIGAGNEHTVVLTADGKVFTCGYNDNGQCGQGGTARVSHLSEIPKMDSGSSQAHAYNGCEHTILVSTDGRVATCGYNYRGQLGHGNTTSESVPKIIRSLENKIVRLVSCSYYHTVLACEDGNLQNLYTFGRNDYGQLGHNDSIDRKIPQFVEALSDQQIVSVACGQYHTMVVTVSGKAFAFGKNDYGQLGIDTMENQLAPVQVRGGLERQECLEIRCGYYHTIALCSGAHLFAFGRNDYGQLGLGRSNASSTSNLQLQQQRFSNARLIDELEGKDIVRIACGCYHTIAVSDNGVMYVFGRNNHGQLGTGDTTERVYPFPIDDFVGKRIALVAAGFYHTVVLTGGKEDDKNEQDSGNDKEEVSASSGITHSTILSSATVQLLLDPELPGFNDMDTAMYMILATLRILQANLSQMLRSGLAKTVILVSSDATSRNTELECMRVAILQVRDVLLSLVDLKSRRNVCNILENSPNEGEHVGRIAEDAVATLMQGFELFFPCQCLRRQFCMHTMHELARDNPEHSCGLLCRRDLWLIDKLPKSKSLLLEPLLRRLTEDSLIVRTSIITEVYQVLLERIAADFSRRLGDVVADVNPRQEGTLRAFFNTLAGLQKHLSSWAASTPEWTLKEDPKAQLVAGIKERVAAVVDRVFRVDEHDLDRVPRSWRCFIEFVVAALGQCCEVLGQVCSMETMPSPTNGYASFECGDESLRGKVLETMEHSIAGQFLPLLVVSLFEFSNNSLFAATLLPRLKNLLRLLDGLNQQDSDAQQAEKDFKESYGTGNFRRKSESKLLTEGQTARKGVSASDAMTMPWLYRLEKELAVLTAEMAVTLVSGDPYFTYQGDHGTTKLSARWLTSSLLRGGLNANYLTQNITQTDPQSSQQGRTVKHTPFPLCDWVRDSYARKDPSYRMILRQSRLSKASTHSVNDTQIEAACFAALLHHNMLGTQAYHFALGFRNTTQNRSSPRSFMRLWQFVAQLRRRVATKKTEIKNLPQKDSDLSALDRISALQQTILDRCNLLLFLNVHEEQEHRNLQLDAGYIAPYDPAFLVSASSTFSVSSSSVKRHLHATYTDEKSPFLVAFPTSKWRRIRTIVHTIIRWKSAATDLQTNRQNHVSQEVLAYILSDERVSSTDAIRTLLVDPCRRVSCSIRGLETLWELLTMVSFDSIQTDVVYQISQVFVFQSSTPLLASHNAGYFYSSLKNETFYEFIGQLTDMITDKAAKLINSGDLDGTSSFWIVIMLLSVWGIHFNEEQFEFVSDIGILDLSRLKETLWVLFRYICAHFAVQNASSGDIYVPTFPVLSGVSRLLYSEAISISNRFLPLQLAVDNAKPIESNLTVPVAVRRSFEVITSPQRFSAQSKGVTCSYDDMISASETTTAMSPLLKPNEFSVTTWLFVNSQSGTRTDNDLFDVSDTPQDRQLIFIRGAVREISLYLLLLPESSGNWQLEVGILMDIDREGDAGELPIKGRIWERMMSKQGVASGKWVHVAIVLEAMKIRLYLNGILDCQRSLVAQSTAIWAAGNVDLPLHFGRFPMTQTTSSVSSAIGFLSRSLGIMKGVHWDSGMNIPDHTSGAFRCFDGWLSHFRFHNRSLSPIHVRIVYDEKKSPSGLCERDDDHSKLVELHALLILLSTSSEGIIHFRSQFYDWMKLIWGTFLGTNSAVVQQSALRVLCALLPLQHPVDASKVLVQETPEALGFYTLEDVFVQQVLRMIGFCLNKCPQRTLEASEAAVVPWTLMLARGIHGNQFSLEVRDTELQFDLENDVERRYQSSKRQSLMLANELNQLLQRLFRNSNGTWRQSIIRVSSNITRNFSNSRDVEPEICGIQFGKHVLCFSTVKCVESVGCLYFLSGGFEFLRPGITVEVRGSRDIAQVLSLEKFLARMSIFQILVHFTRR